MDDLKYLGTITNTKGTDGTLFVDEVPEEICKVKNNSKVLIGFTKNFSNEFEIERTNFKKRYLLLKLKEINSKEEAKHLKENGVFIEQTNILVEQKKDFYFSDIKNFKVYNSESGEEIGKIINEYTMPASDIWVIKSDDNEILIPVVSEIVKKVDMDNKRIEIKVIPGLLEANLSGEDDYDG